jgi:hypothetical protein
MSTADDIPFPGLGTHRWRDPPDPGEPGYVEEVLGRALSQETWWPSSAPGSP